jgi:hypothetical protein
MRRKFASLAVLSGGVMLSLGVTLPAAHASCPPSQATGASQGPGDLYYGTNTSNGAAVGVSGNHPPAPSGYIEVSTQQGVAVAGPSGFIVVGPGGSGSSDSHVGCH